MNPFSLWAKTTETGYWHPLLLHMLDVAAIFFTRHNHAHPSTFPPTWQSFIAALHDIGKCHPVFQSKLPARKDQLLAHGIPFSNGFGKEQDRFPHEQLSADWTAGWLIEKKQCDRMTCRLIATVLQGHHGRFRSGSNWRYQDDKQADAASFEVWDGFRGQLADVLATALELPDGPPPTSESVSHEGLILLGGLVLSDWIASNADLYRFPQLGESLLDEWELESFDSPLDDRPLIFMVQRYWEMAKEHARDVLSAMDLLPPPVNRSEPEELSFHQVWPGFTDPRPLQRVLDSLPDSELPPGLVILEGATGEGKTEAALYLAERWKRHGYRGLYMALPTMATSNEMHGRVARFLKDTDPRQSSPRLVHGMAWLHDTPAPESAPQLHGESDDQRQARIWFDNKRRALLAPNGVGTVDQALLAALRVKFGFLRLYGLAGKVLVVDEVHAYDSYMNAILRLLLQWCHTLSIPVILLSATLSRQQKQQLAEAYGLKNVRSIEQSGYPLVTQVSLDGMTREIVAESLPEDARSVDVVQLECLMGNADGIARHAARQVDAGGCICVLVNTVALAQEVYRVLESLLPDSTELTLLHARFTARERKEREEYVRRAFGKHAGEKGNPPRPMRSILVSTQIVEQSLDVDFDLMITELAPVDLILQRIGRLHRHTSTPRPAHTRPALHLLLPDPCTLSFGPSGFYEDAVLLRSWSLLHRRESIHLPDDYRALVDACYPEAPATTPPDVPADRYQDALNREALRNKRAEDEAEWHLIPHPDPRRFSLANNPDPNFHEPDEDQAHHRLHVQTRLGINTRSLILLDDPALFALAQQSQRPPRKQIQELLWHSVSVPDRWFGVAMNELIDPDPYVQPDWLPGWTVLLLEHGLWSWCTPPARQWRSICLTQSGGVTRTAGDN